jgi:hypothetical protein
MSQLPFLVIALPQVWQNYNNLAAGNAAALAAISWVSYSTGLAGNTLMCAHFAARREAAAMNVQLLGMASNIAVLAQLWLAQVMPTAAFAAAATLAALTAALSALNASGRLAPRLWLPAQAVLSALGVVAVPQVSSVPPPATPAALSCSPSTPLNPAPAPWCHGAIA